MDMTVDSIEAELQPMVLLGLPDGAQRHTHIRAEQDRGVDFRDAGVQSCRFGQTVKRLEFAHAIPFHKGGPAIVHGIAAPGETHHTHNPGEHGFVQLRIPDFLQFLSQVK